MAKKRTIIDQTIPDSDVPLETGEQPELTFGANSEEEELLAGIKKQFATSAFKIKVYKIMSGKSQPVFCFSSEDSVDEEQLQDTYGGGKYALRVYVDSVLKQTLYIEVADKPAKLNGPIDSSSVQNQMLRDQLTWNQQIVLAMLGKSGPVTAPTPMADIVSAWQVLHQEKPTSSLDSMITLFTKGLELGMDRSGNGGGSDWKTELLRTVRDVAPSLTQLIPRNGQPNGEQPAMPNPQPVLLPEQVLQQGIDYIKHKIMKGLPVGLALDWIVSNAEDYNQFLQMALSKNFEDFAKIDPELANEPYNSWFRQLLVGLQEHFKAATQTESEDE